MQAQNPRGSVDFDKSVWPSSTDMNTVRGEDNWLDVANKSFSIDKIRKCFARSPPLSTQDADL